MPKKYKYDEFPTKKINLLKITTTQAINCGDNINYVDSENSIFFSDCNNKIIEFTIPKDKISTSDYVLNDFSEEEKENLETITNIWLTGVRV